MTSELKKQIIDKLYAERKSRMSHPSGAFDSKKRWTPSPAEDAGDITSRIRTPSAAWPFSYMTACRTKSHCTVLVDNYFSGQPVPRDVEIIAIQCGATR